MDVMAQESGRSPLTGIAALASTLAEKGAAELTRTLGGAERTRVIITLACVLGLSGADVATVGASATELRNGLHISNTDIGLLVTTTSLVGAVATLPFGVLADRVRRTSTLAIAIALWAVAMIWSATAPTFGDLLIARVFLGAVTASSTRRNSSLRAWSPTGHARCSQSLRKRVRTG